MIKVDSKNTFLLVFLLGILLYSCAEAPDYPKEPHIEYLRINQTSIEQSGFEDDSLMITFAFTDGDGDLGFSSTSNEVDVFLRDSRSDTTLVTTFKIPEIPLQGVGNGISGEITMMLKNNPFNICCNAEEFPLATPCFPSSFPSGSTETMYFTIQIKDRADHFSNIVQTEEIIIQCN